MLKIKSLIFKSYVIILSIFFLSLISFLIVLTWDESDSLAIFFSYLGSFGFACTVNLAILQGFNKKLLDNESHIKLLNRVALIDKFELYLVDKNFNCLQLKSIEKIEFSESSIKLRTVLNNYEINETYINQIISFISGNSDMIADSNSIIYENQLYITINKPKNSYQISVKPIDKISESFYLKISYGVSFNTLDLNEHSPIGYFELDELGNIVYSNLNFINILGYKLSDFKFNNKRFNNLLYDRAEKLDFTKVNQKFMRFKRADNSIATFLVATSPKYYNKSTHIKGYAIWLRQKEISVFTKNLEKYWLDYSWKCFFDKSFLPVCIIDLSGNILKFNNAYINEIANKKIVNALTDLFLDKDVKTLNEKIENIINSKSEYQIINALNLKNSTKILDIYFNRLTDPNGVLQAIIVRFNDITKQKNLENNLSHAQRMQTIGQLVGSVAHDFNNILTAISGFCDLLLLRHGIEDPSFSNIMQIKQSADRASNLIKRLLAFSRKQTLQLQIANPISLLSEFTQLIQRLIGTKTKFSQRIDPDVWYIKVDVVQMEQVILNLVINAQQAMSGEGILTIDVENFTINSKTKLLGYISPAGERKPPHGAYVMISVSDNGSGINKENIRKIFEPFYTTKSHTSGTGLGLSTVYGIIRQSNAYILVKSSINKGTKFIMFFPKVDNTQVMQHKIEVRNHELSIKKHSLNIDTYGSNIIVLVEDEDAIRTFAKNVLINKGYTVIDFANAKLAFEQIINNKINFDLLITDVLMPEMSGPNLVTTLQKSNYLPKVIFISGFAEEVFTEEYGDNRNFNFLAKPFSLKQLLIKVKEVLDFNE